MVSCVEALLRRIDTDTMQEIPELERRRRVSLLAPHDVVHDPPSLHLTPAETLAAAAQKTLFNIGVADVGTKARDVESNLRKIFELATKWKAILLM
jgi:hypothetical protein